MIRKNLLVVALLLSPLAHADMYFDIRTRTFGTYPASKKIDQKRYDQYAEEFYFDLLDMWQNNSKNVTYVWRLACIYAKKRLEKDTTPTAQRFLEDLALIPNMQAYNDILGYSAPSALSK